MSRGKIEHKMIRAVITGAATTLTVTLRDASSRAIDWLNPIRPALDAA